MGRINGIRELIPVSDTVAVVGEKERKNRKIKLKVNSVHAPGIS